MKKFEYLVKIFIDNGNLSEQMNDYGNEGWEAYKIVTIFDITTGFNTTVFFKREI